MIMPILWDIVEIERENVCNLLTQSLYVMEAQAVSYGVTFHVFSLFHIYIYSYISIYENI